MSDLKRIAVLDDYQNYSQTMADWSSVKAQAEVVVFNRHLSEDEAVDALQDFDAICCVRERMALPASLLRRLPRLRFIAITGVQHRTLDLPVAHAQGIVVSHTIRRGNGQFATAELAWGLIISLARQLPSLPVAIFTLIAAPAVQATNYTTPLKSLRIREYPYFSDDYDFRGMMQALDRQIAHFESVPLNGSIRMGGKK
jgi:hypothetical protein